MFGGIKMKRLHKTPLLLVAISSLLTSCSTTIAGTYGFQLGKDKGTHFGIFLKLTDTKYKTEGTEIDERAKKCRYTFSVNMGSGEGSESEYANIISALVETFSDDGKFSVNGYYYENGKPAKDGTIELKIGVDFTALIDKIIEESGEDIPEVPFPTIDPDTIEKVIYTTYKNAVVTINIPVSEADVLYQLYWYGLDITYSESEGVIFTDYSETAPERCHAPGTHPTPEDVATINETYNYKAEHQAFSEEFGIELGSYRDYYTLAMGLNKN